MVTRRAATTRGSGSGSRRSSLAAGGTGGRLRGLAASLALAGLSLLATLVALEAVFRVLGVSVGTVQINRETVRRSDDPRLLFELRPGGVARAEVDYRVDALGLRGPADDRREAEPAFAAWRCSATRSRSATGWRSETPSPGSSRRCCARPAASACRGARLRGPRLQPRPGDRGAAREGARVLARPRAGRLLPQRPRGPLLVRARPRAGPGRAAALAPRPCARRAAAPIALSLLGRVPAVRGRGAPALRAHEEPASRSRSTPRR